MSALGHLIAARIAATGPITLADYMAECLLHPVHGYYTTREPFGTAGDFITAPEISQIFGELLGLCLAQSWADQGAAARFTLAELGPGRGTLMADILRATRGVAGFHASADVVLVEASPRLRDLQRQTLGDHPARWVDHVDALPDQPLFLVANEFFDALPIRQFQRIATGWAERVVAVRDSALGLALRPSAEPLPHDLPQGTIIETCRPGEQIAQSIAAQIARAGGVALIVDYGDWQSRGDTFQALRAHQYHDVFAAPGSADLTAHVAFGPLAAAARAAGAQATAMMTQGHLLQNLGIAARAERLGAQMTGTARDAHIRAYHRLTHPDEMGSLFKTIAFYPPDQPSPPGFDL